MIAPLLCNADEFAEFWGLVSGRDRARSSLAGFSTGASAATGGLHSDEHNVIGA
jgi:hypothetical protein